ncbi:FRG domain-containing protein [Actibacterium sp. XHP0104]|uniref:FRG domain-containing protein n=1 Tax=Actibacterium sp. XHP0104 TaxID=2984335 RepID=UPI0021E933C4|nr:FRG domain-containing protein [Actibacterium sp. XHP0104]MCV2882157.1 FRG domain-containing protein [Actibacterium sp. XHP0104]
MITETNMNTWNGFYKKICDTCGTGSFGKHFLFRGQRDAGWKLETSFDRSQVGTLVERERAFDKALEALRNRLEFGGIQPPNGDELAGLAQHYGMPTRILDWSYSPYVSMFFACAGALEAGSRPALYILDVEAMRKNVSSKSELSIVDYQPAKNERLRSQRGCFTFLKGDFSSIDDFLVSKNLGVPIITKVKVGRAVIKPALEQLFSMDITYERLFPGLEGSAKQAWLEHILENS